MRAGQWTTKCKVPHDMLLWKIRPPGIQGQLANWIQNCLGDRSQGVVVEGCFTDLWHVTRVLQGIVLGPLLLIYRNYLDGGM